VGIFKQDGSRLAKTAWPTSAVDPLDVPKVLTENLYDTRDYGRNDPVPEGSIKRLLLPVGAIVTQRWINAQYPLATVAAVTPDTGAAAGGEVVTITGTELDGVTSVTFDGVAGTALEIVSSEEIKVTTPAGTAGPADIVLVDDAGNVTEAAGFTYA